MDNSSLLTLARKRASAPTSFERRMGLTSTPDRRGESFSLGVRTRGAPSYDPRANDRANAHLPPRHFWMAGDFPETGLDTNPRRTFKRWSRQ